MMQKYGATFLNMSYCQELHNNAKTVRDQPPRVCLKLQLLETVITNYLGI